MMKGRVGVFVLFLVWVFTSTAEQNLAFTFSGGPDDPIGKSGTVDESEWTAKLAKGRDVLLSGDPAKAVKGYINPVLEHYEQEYKNSPQQIFCAVNSQQSMMYLMSAAVAADLGKANLPDELMPTTFKAAGRKTLNPKAETIVLESTWAEAYFLKAYAAVELGKIEQAQALIKKAVYLSPLNATYWNELGHTHQLLKNWQDCINAFEVAEDAAGHSDPEYKDQDRARAWRGIGFASIELGKLDEAEALFKKCIALNAADSKAQNELNYIAQLKAKRQSE